MRIVQISDTHLSPDKPHFVRNWAPLAAWIADQHPNLVIHTGDGPPMAPGSKLTSASPPS